MPELSHYFSLFINNQCSKSTHLANSNNLYSIPFRFPADIIVACATDGIEGEDEDCNAITDNVYSMFYSLHESSEIECLQCETKIIVAQMLSEFNIKEIEYMYFSDLCFLGSIADEIMDIQNRTQDEDKGDEKDILQEVFGVKH